MLEQIRAVLVASPFLGEGHREVWAWLRWQGPGALSLIGRGRGARYVPLSFRLAFLEDVAKWGERLGVGDGVGSAWDTGRKKGPATTTGSITASAASSSPTGASGGFARQRRAQGVAEALRAALGEVVEGRLPREVRVSGVEPRSGQLLFAQRVEERQVQSL